MHQHLLEVVIVKHACLRLLLVKLLVQGVEMILWVGFILSWGASIIIDHEAVDLLVQRLQPAYLALYHISQILSMLLALLLTWDLGHRSLVVGIGGHQILGLQLIELVVVLDGDGGAALGVVFLPLEPLYQPMHRPPGLVLPAIVAELPPA